MNFERGTQIAYVPDHAEGDLEHPDVEFGFVTSLAGEEDAFCRYWSKYSVGELRTKSNSERTSIRNLVIFASHPQHDVDEAIKQIYSENYK